jgi:hypothetical protein
MPKPHPYDVPSRENLTRLAEDLGSLSRLVREIGTSTTPLFTRAKVSLRIAIMKARIHRMIDAGQGDMPTGDHIPTPAE